MEVITERIYKMLLDERDRDAQRFWIIFSLLSVINGGLFGFAVTREFETVPNIFLAIIGIAICFIWNLVQKRMSFWIKWWEKKLEEIEPVYFKELVEKYNFNGGGKEKEVLSKFKLFCGRRNSIYLEELPHWTYWLDNRKDREYICQFLREKGISTRLAGRLLPWIFVLAWVSLPFIPLIHL